MSKVRFHNQNLYLTGRRGKYYFIQNPRAASTSISMVLGLEPKQHIPAKILKEHVGEKEWNKAFTFGIVRNPYDRIWSQYKNRWIKDQNGERRWNLSFRQFIVLTLRERAKPFYNNPWMFYPQVRWLMNDFGETLVKRIFKKEELPYVWSDIRQNLERVGVYHIREDLPHYHSTYVTPSPFAGEIWQNQYEDDEIRKLVEDWYAADFETYGYKLLTSRGIQDDSTKNLPDRHR